MVTGDNRVTAMAIAKECNIINENSQNQEEQVMEGKEFYDLIEGMYCKTCKKRIPPQCECVKKKKCVEAIRRPE
jgi:Ca2+ transporting ATPase